MGFSVFWGFHLGVLRATSKDCRDEGKLRAGRLLLPALAMHCLLLNPDAANAISAESYFKMWPCRASRGCLRGPILILSTWVASMGPAAFEPALQVSWQHPGPSVSMLHHVKALFSQPAAQHLQHPASSKLYGTSTICTPNSKHPAPAWKNGTLKHPKKQQHGQVYDQAFSALPAPLATRL